MVKRQAIIPAEPPNAEPLSGREAVAHIGSQTVRMPIEMMMAYFTKQLRGIEEWKASADPLSMTLYTGMKQSLNIMIPLIREFLKRRAPELPQMPPRPRHSDPVMFLLGYMNAAFADMVTRGEFTFPVDESGNVTAFEWSYADELEQARALAELPAGEEGEG